MQELDLHDMMDHANAENEKKAKPQPEVTNVETTITTHPTLEGETGETTPTKDTEEKDNILVSHVGEKLHIEVDGKCSQEEANKLEQATDMKILKTAVKSKSSKFNNSLLFFEELNFDPSNKCRNFTIKMLKSSRTTNFAVQWH